MNIRSLRCYVGFVLAALFTLAALLLPSVARAAGSVTAESTNLEEVDGKWKLKLTIDLGKMPDLNFVPMDFVFTPTVYDEMACDDQHPKPFHNSKPLVNQQDIVLPTEVSFSDGMGKAFRKTKYEFTLRRDDRFEAGTYTLQLKRDGASLGNKMTIVLKGENTVVDRRSMSFAGDNRPKKDDPCQPKREKPADTTSNASDSNGGDKDHPKQSSSASGGDGSTPSSGAGGDNPPTDHDSGSQPGTVPPKQGGCGCKTVGASSDLPEGASFAIAALGAALFVSRRRGRAAREGARA